MHTISAKIQKKGKKHSVANDQAWVRWLLCNDIIPKANGQ